MREIGRNDSCLCGSGKKYKKCCLMKDQEMENFENPKGKHFIARVDPDLEDRVDKLLNKMAEKGAVSVEAEIYQIFNKDPDLYITQYMMGVFLSAGKHRHEEAIAYYEKAIEMYPVFVYGYFNLAQCYLKTVQLDRMQAAFKAVVRLDEYGETGLMARQQLDSVESMIRSTTNFKSLDEYIRQSRLFENAFKTMQNREFKEAIVMFESILEKEPEHVAALGNLGLCYSGLGFKEKAINHFDRALLIDPNYEIALLNREVCLMSMTEGQAFIADNVKEVQYYRDYGPGRKSYLKSLMNDLSGSSE